MTPKGNYCKNVIRKVWAAYIQDEWALKENLNLTAGYRFRNSLTAMDSATSLERGYADMTMIVRPDMRQYPLLDFLAEFKYMSLKDTEMSDEKLRQVSNDELKALPLISHNLSESKTKLAGYRKTLLSEYGSRLRLRTYSLVSIGFERLIWEELRGTA